MPTLSVRFVPPRQNRCRSIATLLALTILAGSAQFVLGIPAPPPSVPALTLTEESSTILNYSWTDGFVGSGSVAISISKVTGLPVPDSWNGTITGPAEGGAVSLSASWQEADSSLFNNVTVQYQVTDKGNFWNVEVHSDASAQFVHLADGGTVNYIGTAGPFSVTFIDQAAASEVPEGGTTVIMLSLAVGCLALIRRRIAAA